MSKQSDALLSYLRSGKDMRSPSFVNMRRHSGYSTNRALTDGLRMLMRAGLIEKKKTGYFPATVRDFSIFRNQSGGTLNDGE